MPTYIDGLLYGLIFLFSLGPAFLALFQTASNHGFSRAISVSIGVNMTDAVLVGLVIVGLSSFLEDDSIKTFFGAVGVIVLLVFGILHNDRLLYQLTQLTRITG